MRRVGSIEPRILCITGTDRASVVALARARQLQEARGGTLQAVFVRPALPDHRMPNASSFCRWAFQVSGICLAPEDSWVTTGPACADLLDQMSLLDPHTIVVLPAPRDSSLEVAMVSPRTVWGRAVRAGASLLIAKEPEMPARLLVAQDGTARTLPLLDLAFELAGRMGAELEFFATRSIPMHGFQSDTTDPALGDDSANGRGDACRIPGLPFHFAARLARASMESASDMILLDVAPGEELSAFELTRVARCSVWLVPRGTLVRGAAQRLASACG